MLEYYSAARFSRNSSFYGIEAREPRTHLYRQQTFCRLCVDAEDEIGVVSSQIRLWRRWFEQERKK